MNNDLLSLAVHRVMALSLREKVLLHEVIATEHRFARLSRTALSRIVGRRLKITGWNPADILRKAEKDARSLQRGDMKCLAITDADYPAQLAEIYDPPYLLFYRGVFPRFLQPGLAVVGTRRPTGAGIDAAFEMGFQAADAGLPVVSGLAMGVDTAAHRGALSADGYTAAVLGSGCDRLYPRSSAPVGRNILTAGGCILSEFPPGTDPKPYHFPQRNRIISGLCRGVVVVQAPGRSGALITADFALEQGRDLFVHGGLLDSPLDGGCRELADAGAPAVVGVADILRDWDVDPPVKQQRRDVGMAAGTGKTLARALQEEIEGTLVRHRGKFYRRVYQHG